MLQITPEQQTKIDQATEFLPEGFVICSKEQVNKLIDLKDTYEADSQSLELAKKIFRKVQPVFSLFAGKENLGMMGLMQSVMSDPKITEKITAITNDAELKTDFETIAKIL